MDQRSTQSEAVSLHLLFRSLCLQPFFMRKWSELFFFFESRFLVPYPNTKSSVSVQCNLSLSKKLSTFFCCFYWFTAVVLLSTRIPSDIPTFDIPHFKYRNKCCNFYFSGLLSALIPRTLDSQHILFLHRSK